MAIGYSNRATPSPHVLDGCSLHLVSQIITVGMSLYLNSLALNITANLVNEHPDLDTDEMLAVWVHESGYSLLPIEWIDNRVEVQADDAQYSPPQQFLDLEAEEVDVGEESGSDTSETGSGERIILFMIWLVLTRLYRRKH